MAKQKLSDLRQTLERWKSHSEVHADSILYEFLSDFLKIVEGTAESVHPSLNEENEINDSFEQQDDQVGEPGGNNPPHKPPTP